MKILFINLSDYPIPPPTNVIRADTYISVPLAEELQNRGNDVYFLCPPGSTVHTKKIFSSHPPLSSVMTLNELIQTSNMAREVELTFWFDMYFTLIESVKKFNFDLIHFHTNTPLSELTALSKISTPCVFTLHSYPQFPDIYAKFFNFFNARKNNYFVSISAYQQKKFTSTPFIKTIYNGIEITDFTFDEKGGDRMLFAGRIVKEKGIKEAILTAIRMKKELIITGSIDPSTLRINKKDYFTEEVAPLIEKNNNQIQFINKTDRSMMTSFYTSGKVTLVPIAWDEPFGLVMIESMAAGTPVIAFSRGSVPEIVKDGETGFIVNPSDDDIRGNWIIKKTGIEGLCEAVERIYAMSEDKYHFMRRACRTHVETNFSMDNMVDEYVHVYKKILSQSNN